MTTFGALEQIAEQIRALPLGDLRLATDPEVAQFAELGGTLGRLIGNLNIAIAVELVERSRPQLGHDGMAARYGKTKPAQLVEQLARVSNAEATRRVRLAAALSPGAELAGWERPPRYPALADAMGNGLIDADAAEAIVGCLEQSYSAASDENLRFAESLLVDFATRESASEVAVLARATRDRLDPEGVRPREEESRTRRGIRLGRERHGVTPISGGLDPEFAALLKAEFDAANAPGATPRFVALEKDNSFAEPHPDTETVIDADGAGVLRMKDERTREQRQHDVFFGVFKAGVRSTGAEPGALRSTADVTITIGLSDLRDGVGPGYLEGIDEPVSARTVERLLCDATWRKAVLGANGEPLALGKTQYRFSRAQKRAILLRDGDTCVMCDSPASWGDFHHVVPFNADGGKGSTDLDNGVNLCGRHHDLMHHSGWKMRIRDRIPEVLPPPEIDWSGRWKPVGKNRTRRTLSATG